MRRIRSAVVLMVAVIVWLAVPTLRIESALAATPTISPGSVATLTVEPMLNGNFRSGSWAAIKVHVENAGPAIDGELRLTYFTNRRD